MIAAAVLPDFDVSERRFVRGLDAAAEAHTLYVAKTCDGVTDQSFTRALDDGRPGKVKVQRIELPPAWPRAEGVEGAWLVRLSTGYLPGICDEHGHGFFAVVERRGDALRVAGTVAWDQSCTAGEVAFLTVAGHPGFYDKGSDSGDEGVSFTRAAVVVSRGDRLVRVGTITTESSHWRAEAEGHATQDLSARLEPHPSGVLALETWTAVPHKEGPGARSVSRKVVYTLRGDKLEGGNVRPPL